MRARRVVCVVSDLFFSARIAEAAKTLNVMLDMPAADRALDACRSKPPDLVILDLLAPEDPLALARELKSDVATRGIPIVGFYAHVDRELRQAAFAAGIDHVLPRSAFTAKLATLLAGGTSNP